MIQASGIDHIVLHCSDVGRSKVFYTSVLGMTVYRENDGQVFCMRADRAWRCSGDNGTRRRQPPAMTSTTWP
jgi:catechol 2,3-dioxygenase-like lactoylglutathione lyase family enzyme